MKLDANKTNGTSPPHLCDIHQEGLTRGYRDPAPMTNSLGTTYDILTMDEVAAWLRMKASPIYELTRSRSQVRHEFPFPVLRFHRKALRIERADVQQWLDALCRRTTEMHAASNVARAADELRTRSTAVAKHPDGLRSSRNASVIRRPPRNV